MILVSPVQVEEFGSVSNLEIPIQERLLPIGSLQKDSIPVLVDRIKNALGIPENVGEWLSFWKKLCA